jgi:hypothetical protein
VSAVSRRTGRLLLVAALGLAACAGDEERLAARDAAPCLEDLDCGDGLRCMAGACGRETDAPLERVSIELVPPAGAAAVRTQLLDLERGDGALGDLRLERGIELPVRVLDASGRPVAARITIEGTPRIPGREVDVAETLSPDRPLLLRLAPGRYAARFDPLDPARPGVAVDAFEIRETTTGKDFELPASYRRLFGTVRLRTDGNVLVPGVRVRAVSVPSGLVSSSAVTDETGAYSILLPDTHDPSVRVVAELDGDARPAWRFEQEIGLVVEGDRRLDIGFEPTPDPLRGLASVRVLGMGDRGPEPIAGARVTLTASTAVPTQVFTVSGVTDAEGTVVVQTDAGVAPLEVVAAEYRALVEPPTRSVFARTTITLDLRRTSPSFAPDKHVELPRRVQATGAVLTEDGRSVDGAVLDLEPLDLEGARLRSVTTDLRGGFSVWLDPGRYAVRVAPSAESALPTGRFAIQVPRDALTFPIGTLRLPGGRVASGRILDVDGRPVQGAEVEVFGGAESPVTSLARVQSDAGGRFSVVLPAR